MDNLAGKTAFVTGAASGMGQAMARRFAAEGMQIVLADIEEEPLAAAEAELSAQGCDVLSVRVDVRDLAEVERAAQAALARFGGVHLVCNNAGVCATGHVEDVSLEAWRWVIDVNLWGVVHGCRVFLPILKRQGEPAHFVNTASMAGLSSGPYMSPYFVSKFGVVALSEAMWHELQIEKSPVGVSVLCPGFVRTRIHESGRNRPGEVGSEVAGEPGQAYLSMLGAGVEGGLDPAAVADLVLDAIRTDRFYVLPHAEDAVASVRARAEAIADGRAPRLPKR